MHCWERRVNNEALKFLRISPVAAFLLQLSLWVYYINLLKLFANRSSVPKWKILEGIISSTITIYIYFTQIEVNDHSLERFIQFSGYSVSYTVKVLSSEVMIVPLWKMMIVWNTCSSRVEITLCLCQKYHQFESHTFWEEEK